MSLLGRAELLRGLWLAQQHHHAEPGLALAAGYALEANQGEGEESEPSDVASTTRMALHLGNNAEHNTATHPQAIPPTQPARCWGVTEHRKILAAPLPTTTSQEQHLAPLHPADWQAAPGSVRQAWHSIVPKVRFMPALKRSLPSQRLGGLDTARLVQALSQGVALRRLPRRVLKGWAAHVLLVLDMSEALLPYHTDMHILVQDLRRWLGPGNVTVRLINDTRYPLGEYASLNVDGTDVADVAYLADANAPAALAPSGWLGAACNGRVLLVSEMGLLAADGGQTTGAWATWLHVLGKQGAQVQVWCPVPLGLAEQSPDGVSSGSLSNLASLPNLPRIPVVHWSAASHLRPRPLARADIHRTPERLQLAQQLCTLLAMLARVEPDLLRALRLGMGPAALDAGLEQLAWNHPAMTRNYSARAIKAASVPAMRQAFARLSSAEKQRVFYTAFVHHTAHNPMLAHVETLTWAAHATEQERAERGQAIAIATAQEVMQRLAHNPWQHPGLDKASVCQFMARYLHDADQKTREFCSPSMSRMALALHHARKVSLANAPITTGLPGLAVVDMAAAIGQQREPVPYWLSLERETACLVLRYTKPPESCLLHPQPVLLDCLSIQMGEVVRWVQVNPPHSVVLARLDSFPHAAYDSPMVDGPLYIDTGTERFTLAEIDLPAWACGWGREGGRLYAHMPSPWGKPLPVPYPREGEALHVSVPVPKPKKEARFTIQSLRLGLDEIGPLATLTVRGNNGEHSQTLRFIAPGQFLMGSPEAETAGPNDHEWFKNERPQHWVSISQGFWLADTACTQGFWQAVMGNNLSYFHALNKGSPLHPVENLSWRDIQPFLQVLQTALPDCMVTLPTEAEWEYACRAGTATAFSFGETINTDQVNYDGRHPFAAGEKGEFRVHTLAVKALPANAWGLYQMHGNVREWCADEFRQYTAESVQDLGLPDALRPKVNSGAARVLRGGGWFSFAQFVRSAYRGHGQPGRQNGDAGFRLALRFQNQASGV